MSSVWYAAFALLALLSVSNAVLGIATLRQVGVLHQRLRPTGPGQVEGPSMGDQLPMLPFVPVAEAPAVPLLSAPVTVMLYVTPGCTVCRAVPDIVRAYLRHRGEEGTELVFVTDVPVEAARRYADDSELPAPLLQSDTLSKAWELPGSPYVLALRMLQADLVEVLSAGVVNTLEQLEDLIGLAHSQRELFETAPRRLLAAEPELAIVNADPAPAASATINGGRRDD